MFAAAIAGSVRTIRCHYNGSDSSLPFINGEVWPPSDRYSVRALNAETPTWGANTSARLLSGAAQAVTNKGLLIVNCHDGLASAGNIRTGFDDLVAWAAANPADIDVTTMRDLQFLMA